MKIWEKHFRLQPCDASASPSPLASPVPSPTGDAICGNPIILDAGESAVIVPINFVTEAMITKVIVARSSPDAFVGPTHFTVDLFNKAITEDAIGTPLEALCSVIPQQTTLINNTMELFSGNTGAGWSFINLDGNPTAQVRKIYLRIGLVGGVGGDASSWDLALAGIMTGQGT